MGLNILLPFEQSANPIIAGDRNAAYGGVMHAIGLVHDAGISAIALENANLHRQALENERLQR